MKQVFKIPERFTDIRYNTQRIPGVEKQSDLSLGANCQVYAYELLRHYGKSPPLLRSSELWSDEQFTQKVSDYEFLDLMLYNNTLDAYGAHVGVYINDGLVLHLSKEIGCPAIQKHEALLLNKKYTYSIGVKRVLS